MFTKPKYQDALYRVIYADGSPEAIGAFPITKRETEIDVAEKILIIFNRSGKHRPISAYDLVVVNGVTFILSRTGWAKVPDAVKDAVMKNVKVSVSN